MMNKNCIILPCAGKGTRLGLSYPKELHYIAEDEALIDQTLKWITESGVECAILIVISIEKLELIVHLEKKWNFFKIKYVVQRGKEFVGSLTNLEHCIGEFNLVLLPDQFVSSKNGINEAFEALRNRSKAVFLAKDQSDSSELADDGALLVQNSELQSIAEKPGLNNCSKYNASWCGVGFAAEQYSKFILDISLLYTQASLSGGDIAQTIFFKSPIIYVDEYYDLGTWPRLQWFLKDRMKYEL